MAKAKQFATLAVLACAGLLLSTRSSAQDKPAPNCTDANSSEDLPARYELNQGIDAYKAARYSDAITHFQKAADAAPCLRLARVYLATALAQNVVPALNTADNIQTADAAIENFKLALAQNSHDTNSLKQVASVYFNIKRLDDAREWQKRVLLEDPNDAEAAYTIGVIDWTQAHLNTLTLLATANLQDDGTGNAQAPVPILEQIKQKNDSLVAEALQYLTQAIADRPDYDDAMAYINLVYRRKADVDYADQKLRDEDIAQAHEWAQKAMQTRREHEEKKVPPPQ